MLISYRRPSSKRVYRRSAAFGSADVQKAIELAVAAPVDADGDMTAARAGHGRGAALGGEAPAWR